MGSPPRRFVIVSQPRCGTHLLRHCLRSHPDVECHDEIFHPAEGVPRPPCIRGATSADDVLARLWAGEGKVTGFLLHEFQARQSWAPGAFRALARVSPSPLVIWLTRRDRLAQYVSHQEAFQTGQWQLYSRAEKREPRPITADPQEVVMWWHKQLGSRRHFREILAGLPSTEVVFEELVEDPGRVCAALFERLGLAPHPARPKTIRQAERSLAERLLNHREVLDALRAEGLVDG